MRFEHILFGLLSVFALSFSSCSEEENDAALIAKFSLEDKTFYANESILLTNETTGGSGSYTFLWELGDGTTSTEKNPAVVYTTNGTYSVKLIATDSKGKSAVAQKVVVVEPEPIPSVGNLTLKWVSSVALGEIRSVTPAVSDDNFIYMTSEDHVLRKFNAATGQQVWAFDLWTTADGAAPEGRTLSSPSIDAYNGVIYVGTGESSGKTGRVYAVNPDGSKKWVVAGDANTGFWNKGSASTPRINYLTCPMDENYVYMGNGGSTGSVIAVNKNTGARHGYVANATGDGGPAGGVSGGLVMTKSKTLIWTGQNNGLFGVPASALAAGGNTTWTWNLYTTAPNKTSEYPNGSPAIGSNGTVYVAATFAANDNRVLAFSAEGVTVWETQLGEVGKLDQGGVVIAADGTVIVSLKRAEGESNGGIVALNPTDGSVKWQYGIPEDVSGTAAIDQAGNIHFGTQSGNYYVVKANGSNAELVVKRDIAALIAENGNTNWSAETGRIWSSPTIGDDGVIYIGITNTNDNAKSALVALTDPGITGVADSAWPMRGQNRKHTNTQK
ncbi:outer membrane protein assembly factor BamB family protein [Viscerimonas tarda]